MSRIRLTDGSGQWFDSSKSELFEEDTWWNGNNHISYATGDQFKHEQLFKTAGGRYILNSWSQWQGSTESYEEITSDEAAQWLSVNNYDSVPDDIQNHIDAMEIA